MLKRADFEDEFAFNTFNFLIALITRYFGDQPVNGVEIGTMKGESAFHMLNHCKNVFHLFTVDPWAHVEGSTMEQARPRAFHENNYYIALERLKPLGERVTIIRDFSDDFFLWAAFKDFKFDFIWIDGHHEREQVDKDIVNAKKLIKPGGLILGHDFHNCPGVKEGVNEAFSGRTCFVNEASQIWFIPDKEFLGANNAVATA